MEGFTSFERVWVLIFLAPAALFLLGPAFRALRGAAPADAGSSPRILAGRRREIASAMLRLLAVAALICALAGPELSGAPTEVHTVFLVDVSESMADRSATRRVLESLFRVLPSSSPCAVAIFGGDASLEADFGDIRPGADLPLDLERPRKNPDRRRTDIGAAISFAAAQFPDAAKARLIVLVGDGRDNAGGGVLEARAARLRGARLCCAPVDMAGAVDVRIESLAVPARARRGAAIPVDVVVRSDGPARGRALLFREGAERSDPIAAAPFELRAAGWTSVRFRDRNPPAGVAGYVARLDVPSDAFLGNNDARGATLVAPARRAAVVCESDSPLWKQLADQAGSLGIEIRHLRPRDVPPDPAALRRHDIVLLDGLPLRAMRDEQWRAICEFVRNMGGGLLATGGPDAFGAGGHLKDGLLEQALPVLMEPEDDRVIHYIFILDASRSMAEPTPRGPKIEVAAEAVLDAMRGLRERDIVTVIAFSGDARVIVDGEPLSRMASIEEKVRGIVTRANTDILKALVEARARSGSRPADRKIALLISDGRPEGVPPQEKDLPPVAESMREAGCILSTFLIGDDERGAELMAEMAGRGGGRAYRTGDVTRLREDLKADIERLSRDKYVREGAFRPAISAPHPAVLPAGPWPELAWRNRTGRRPDAITVVDTGGKRPDPVLALAHVGRGRSAVLCFPFSGEAGARFFTPEGPWRGGGMVLAGLIGWLLGGDEDPGITATAENIGDGIVRLRVDAATPEGLPGNFLKLRAAVSGGREADGGGLPLRVQLQQTGPGRYEAELPRLPQGTYMALIEDDGGGQRALSRQLFSVPCSPEYAALGADRDHLRRLADAGGGRLVEMPSDLAEVYREMAAPSGSADIRPFLAAASILFLLIELAIGAIGAAAGSAPAVSEER
ncbi:MAG: VWA domain-containing protein [Planctomycetota bacterium]|nr:VWA domain-containing protein [Planctomycetota bacterium]